MTTKQTKNAHILAIRQVSTELLGAIDKLNAIRATWDAGMSTWIKDKEDKDKGDFGQHEGIKKQDIADVLGTTLDAINELMTEGHRTNLEKIRL